MALTKRDLRLLALIYDVNFLSASQLIVLGWGVGERAGQQRLKLLHDNQYLDRFRPVTASGSTEWNYRLTAHGWATLAQRGLTLDERSYAPTRITSVSYTEHDLQIAAIILAIAQSAAPKQPDALIDRLPFQWLGSRRGRIETEPTQDSDQAQSMSPSDTPRHIRPEDSRAGYLEPDATLIGGEGDGQFAVLIEYDRTDRPHKQVDRLRRYDHWLLKGWHDTCFATHAMPPSVIFITARDRPLHRLIETAHQTLSAWHGHEQAIPSEGTHPARQRIVFTTRGKILNGDWMMYRMPSLPTRAQTERSTHTRRQVNFNLPALFSLQD
jgi:hypothetical protein